MAGSQQLAMANQNEEEGGASMTMMMIAMGDGWEVQYSRLFTKPLPPSSAQTHHPYLSSTRGCKGCRGSWISSSSSAMSLRLTSDHSSSNSVLRISFRRKILEEHYVSKLHFTWPQVSCVSGYPPRGSRVILVSYKDHIGQIQKFGMRFLTIYDTERFITSLKEILEGLKVDGLACSNSRSELSSQSEFNPQHESLYRPINDWTPPATSQTSSQTSSQQLPPSLKPEISQSSNSQDTMNKGVGANLSAFPPRFTSLLMQCHPAPAQEQSVPKDVDLKTEIMKYLDDSSFQDMLSKVEKVMSEIGGDLLL